jgi:hypothetical protein
MGENTDTGQQDSRHQAQRHRHRNTVFWQVGDRELGTYDCGPLLGYTVKGSIIPPAGATFGAATFERTTTAGTIKVGDKTINICLAAKPVGLVSLKSGDTPSTVIWGGSRLRITEVSPPSSIWADDGAGQDGPDNPNKGTTSRYWLNWVKQAIDPLTGKPVNVKEGDQQRIPGVDLGIQYMGYGTPYEGRPREVTVQVFSNDPDNRAHRPFIKMFEFQNVSARITDFNGRALPGAFYQLIDAQTGKSAAWSYAGPDGRIIPMPIRKPGGVFIQRVNIPRLRTQRRTHMACQQLYKVACSLRQQRRRNNTGDSEARHTDRLHIHR